MNISRKKSIVFLVLAAVLWSTGGILIKLVDWNPIAIAGTRSGVSAILMYFYIIKKNKDSKLLSPKIKLTKIKFLGGCVYAATVILFVLGNKLTTSANVILLQYTAPIWVALFSGYFLKEKVKKGDWISIFFVMSGMVLFFVGDINTGQMIGNFVSVLSGFALAGVVILLKLQKEGSAVEMTFVGNIITLIVSIPFILWSMPSTISIIGIILLGIFQLGLSYILYSEAIFNVTAVEAILIPVIEPLLNPIWVFLFNGEKPSLMAIIGGMIVVSSVVIRNIIANKKNKSCDFKYKESTS
ncbi:DMT family transporter [Helicovermis profundi]|uniref:DMT family transporter n=1 Tax=Helicovermis profundi TaxID=3065157 RepID=A0AAU9EBR7_9FIRM|nr:DMT family transporter [Clostridia bacterium S502]